MKPFVSVIMTAHNEQEHIAQAIESILNQTYKDFELLIIDDASTDSTRKVIRSYDDSRIRLLCLKKNQGPAAAANKGLDLAKGEYIARLDADDWSERERLEKQVAFLQNNPSYHMCATSFTFFCKKHFYTFKKKYNHVAMKKKLIKSCFPIIHSSVMYKNSSFCYDVNKKVGEDYDLWLRFLKEGKKIALISQVLTHYRIDGTGLLFDNFIRAHYSERRKITLPTKIQRELGMIYYKYRFNAPFTVKKLRVLHKSFISTIFSPQVPFLMKCLLIYAKCVCSFTR